MRDDWLDTLRAMAISAVLVAHGVQMSPQWLSLAKWTSFGTLGVDLFFVLSGWLIGTLFWKEQVSTGRVDLFTFWRRRWWRTLPGYYVALAASWLAVFVVRREPFDLRFLLFLQNYLEVIPFFLVSWSLCIEEHFYVLLPPVAQVWSRLRLPRTLLFAMLACLPMLLRYLASPDAHKADFGLHVTATHLRMEGLVLGFWASSVPVHASSSFARLKRSARIALLPLTMLAVWSAGTSDERARYVIGSTAMALAMTALLLAGVDRAPSRWLMQPAIRALALSSYSIYLTHALMIHVARAASARLALGVPGYFAFAVVFIGLCGAAFYWLVEKPSLRLRERFTPQVRAIGGI